MFSNFQFVMRSGPTPGAIFPLDKDQLTIGRDAANVVAINDADMSRKHARMSFQAGKYVIEDLGSTNGTYVNGQRLAGPFVLKPGDVVSLGEQIVLMYDVVNEGAISKKNTPILNNYRIFGDMERSTIGTNAKDLDKRKSGRKLNVFLCHSSQDKPVVREIHQKLISEKWIDPWLDEEKLLPGQDWDMEIEKAVESADVVIVCLSNNSVSKEGYIQRELRFVLDIALTKPEETIFIIPLRLDNCQPPRRLRLWQYEDYFPKERKPRAYERLLASFRIRANAIGINL